MAPSSRWRVCLDGAVAVVGVEHLVLILDDGQRIKIPLDGPGIEWQNLLTYDAPVTPE